MARDLKRPEASEANGPRPKAVGRLSLYRRVLRELSAEGMSNIFSHQLAETVGASPAQVRRDLMHLGYSGHPRSGYDVLELARSIDECLDEQGGQRAALMGVGYLGSALAGRLAGQDSNLELVAAFDSDPAKQGTEIAGCRIYPMSAMAEVVSQERIGVAILAVPGSAAQTVAEECASAGVRGILNFAPVHLRVPEGVYVLNVDLTMALETVAFFARRDKQNINTVSGA